MAVALNQNSSSDILKSILATLQTLEIRFEDQNMRLVTIESSIVSSASSGAGSSPRSPDPHNLSPMSDQNYPTPELEDSHPSIEYPTAPAYVASMLKLQKRFSFDEGVDDDCQSQ